MYVRFVGEPLPAGPDVNGTVTEAGSIETAGSEAALIELGLRQGDAVVIRRNAAGCQLTTLDPRPRKLYVELTTDCNLDCAMCIRHAWEEPEGRMSLDTFTRLLASLTAGPAPLTLSFGGYGEPMTHPRFFEFVKRAKRDGFMVEVFTNGLLLTSAARQQLLSLGVDRLIVSVDGIAPNSSPHLHADSFAEVRKNLVALKQEKLARTMMRPEVVIEFVASRRNIDQLPHLRSLSIHLGFTSIVVTNLVPHTAALANEILYDGIATAPRKRSTSLFVPAVDLPLLDADPAVLAALAPLQRSGSVFRVNGQDVAGAGPRCRFVAEGRLAVGWDGSVSPCLPLLHTHEYFFRGRRRRVRRYRVGNVNHTPFPEIWARAEYAGFRERVRRFEFAPCIDCGSCDFRDTNEQDCMESEFPCCGECLWAAGLIQCP